MADVTVNIKGNTEGVEQSLASLNKQLKGLIAQQQSVAQGTKEWDKLAKAINETEGKIGDLKDSFQTLRGSGVERLNSSVGLLSEGFRNFDTEKIKIGFKGLSAAMSAVPAFLLVQAFQALVQNWDKVVEVGKVIIGSFSEQQIEIKKLNHELELQKQATATLSKELTREIAELEASGKSHEQIIAKKKELIQTQIQEAIATAKLNLAKVKEVQNNDTLYESYLKVNAQVLRKIGADEKADEIEKQIALNKKERNEENVKSLNDSIELIKDLQSKATVEQINNDKKAYDNRKALNDKKIEEAKKQRAIIHEIETQAAAIDAENKRLIESDLDEEREANKEREQLESLDRIDRFKKSKETEVEIQKKTDEDKAASDRAVQDSVVKGLEATQSLANTFGQLALQRNEGNAKRELEIRKKMFQVDKAFNVARAVIDGIRSVQAALTIPPPGGQILAVINGVAAAANVAKILSTKFEGGNISASSTPSVPSLPASNSQTPSSNVLPQQTQQSTTFDAQGKNLNKTTKVVVLQSDIKNELDSVAKVEQQARF